jgi:hypothetical protein
VSEFEVEGIRMKNGEHSPVLSGDSKTHGDVTS